MIDVAVIVSGCFVFDDDDHKLFKSFIFSSNDLDDRALPSSSDGADFFDDNNDDGLLLLLLL